jgi:methylenetetrahydrofolate dehydrogenase (NADP+)/methenyltetrahydrofolate cyclohydrolase
LLENERYDQRDDAAEKPLHAGIVAAFQVRFLPRPKARAVPAQILDGRAVANDLRAELSLQSEQLRERGIHPSLVIVLAGENEASVAYVRNLVKLGERLGIAVAVDELPENTTAARVRERLEALGGDPGIHGVMLQQPLPPHLTIRTIADSIPIHKDVDGTHPTNQGHLAFGSGAEFVPATPAAVMLLLERSPHWPLRGHHAVMIGRSVVVGAPVAMLMLARDATVTILHKESSSLQPYARMADVLVIATGVPNLIGGSDIKPGATIVDVGTTLIDGQLKGDVDFDSAVQVAGAITPVPGGVGPVTNVALLRNVIQAASNAGKPHPRD